MLRDVFASLCRHLLDQGWAGHQRRRRRQLYGVRNWPPIHGCVMCSPRRGLLRDVALASPRSMAALHGDVFVKFPLQHGRFQA